MISVKRRQRMPQAASSSLDAPLLAECQATGDKQASSQDRSGVAPSTLTQELIRGVISPAAPQPTSCCRRDRDIFFFGHAALLPEQLGGYRIPRSLSTLPQLGNC